MATRPLLALAALAVAGAAAGCSGTPFGDQLARSFSAPPAEPQGPAAAASGTGAGSTAVAARPPGASGAATQPASPAAAQPAKGAPSKTVARPAAKPVAKLPATPASPAPYRITLRLPGADPSAPAEAVTEALRAAGVSFEVEMIERVRGGEAAASPAAPTSAPAPAPR